MQCAQITDDERGRLFKQFWSMHIKQKRICVNAAKLHPSYLESIVFRKYFRKIISCKFTFFVILKFIKDQKRQNCSYLIFSYKNKCVTNKTSNISIKSIDKFWFNSQFSDGIKF